MWGELDSELRVWRNSTFSATPFSLTKWPAASALAKNLVSTFIFPLLVH